MSRTWNTRIKQNIYLSLKSYSPWSHVSSTMPRCRLVLGYKLGFVSSLWSYETQQQFDYNLSSKLLLIDCDFSFFEIIFKMSRYKCTCGTKSEKCALENSISINNLSKRETLSRVTRKIKISRYNTGRESTKACANYCRPGTQNRKKNRLNKHTATWNLFV